MKNYNYIIGEEVVFFDGRDEYYGVVSEVKDNTVLCIMGDDKPIEYPKGGIIPLNEVEDLFNSPELIPQEVNDILLSFNEDANGNYDELERLLDELEPLGYTFSYYLDAEPYWLRRI